MKSDSFLFVPLISDVANAMSKVLTDSNPEMKEAAAEFIIEFSLALREKCGASMKKVFLLKVRLCSL